MKVKATISFTGALSMSEGEEMELDDKDQLQDLLNAGYVNEVKQKKAKKSEKNET